LDIANETLRKEIICFDWWS